MWPVSLALVSIILNLCICNGACPKKCVCDHGAAFQAVQCFRVQAIPSGLARDTKKLNLAYNHIKEVKGRDLSGLPDLEDVLLSSAGVEQVENNAFRAQSRLRYLDLQKNKLHLLPRGLPTSLETLKVSYNQIHTLQESALENLKKLRLLDLQNNYITTLRANVLSGLVKLEWLHLDGNRIETVQGSLRLSQLNLLSFASNRIPSFPSAFFTPLKSLTTLCLAGNLLSRVPNDLPGSLTLLSLDKNQIRSLRNREMAQLRNLTSLSASHNRLVTVDSALRLPKLIFLEVPGNFLRVLPSRLSPRLERLDCKQNALQEVSFQHLSGMRELRHLFLENNTIKIFEANALRNSVHLANLALEQNLLSSIPDGLPESLIRLDLKGNQISAIQESQLSSMRRLQVLNLRRNRLTALPQCLPKLLPKLSTLILDGNPWNCTCQLQRLKRALVARGVEMSNEELCSEKPVGAPLSDGGEWRSHLMEDRCEEEEDGEDMRREEQDVEITDDEEYYDYDE
ncbi:nephrocan-like [Centroberyx affinis]|uniref:nephrocan-like n=1 Tax=Centroberyx affinis TaxID=166261 RepID=UPI003A5C2696